jgi:Zn finger protein HypA/HybF involved in hydrogenase expression
MSGITYIIPCPQCGKNYEITYGNSMICTNRALTVSCLHTGGRPLLEYLVKSKSIKEKTFELLNDGYILNAGYQYSTYYCKKCRKIFTRFYYSLSKNENTWEPEYRCWCCKGKIARIMQENMNQITVSCKCGHIFNPDLKMCPEPEFWS